MWVRTNHGALGISRYGVPVDLEDSVTSSDGLQSTTSNRATLQAFDIAILGLEIG